MKYHLRVKKTSSDVLKRVVAYQHLKCVIIRCNNVYVDDKGIFVYWML